jgi:transcriptional regulator with XRE-family HTH domain
MVQVFSGAALRFHREANHLTRRELAAAIGRNEVSIYDWEWGKNAPNAKFLPLLADRLAISILDLFEDAT